MCSFPEVLLKDTKARPLALRARRPTSEGALGSAASRPQRTFSFEPEDSPVAVPCEELIRVDPLFRSLKTTLVSTSRSLNNSDRPEATVASVISAFPPLHPNSRDVIPCFSPRGPAVVTAISRSLLSGDRNILRCLDADSSLMEEARKLFPNSPMEAIYRWSLRPLGDAFRPQILGCQMRPRR